MALRLRRCTVDVNGERRLLALVATHTHALDRTVPSVPTASGTTDSSGDSSTAGLAEHAFRDTVTPLADYSRVDDVLVYLHGFPDMSVHPTRLEFASRMPRKLADAWLDSCSSATSSTSGNLSAAHTSSRTAAFVAFNFGGVPGSDSELRFAHKTISQEVDDAIAVCAFARQHLLKTGVGTDTRSSDGQRGATSNGSDSDRPGRVHVVGLSTGAIVASLLRDRRVADSITAIAGLADLARGVAYDFTPAQLAECERDGACWKEFYLPDGSPLPQNAELSLDGETAVDLYSHSTHQQSSGDGSDSRDHTGAAAATAADAPSKLFIRLDRAYVDECRCGTLDIKRAVSTAASSPPPLLVVHGDADRNVPYVDGEELFRIASEPKTFLPIARANHLLTNAKHLKRALAAIVAHTSWP